MLLWELLTNRILPFPSQSRETVYSKRSSLASPEITLRCSHSHHHCRCLHGISDARPRLWRPGSLVSSHPYSWHYRSVEKVSIVGLPSLRGIYAYLRASKVRSRSDRALGVSDRGAANGFDPALRRIRIVIHVTITHLQFPKRIQGGRSMADGTGV